ncbi:MAG TPA: DNA mismatch endonuclease Vsr [Candidatus Desulfobacillus sp.]|nr:DNA mismatch endonuclease Vsr [Candidatus Desulfobacillus sp.]
MTDVVAPEVRSRMMAAIRGADTRPEMLVRRFLHRHGLRYRLHAEELPGKPDLVFPRHGAVVFVHGCYWHRHQGCKYATMPSSNVKFWKTKFRENVIRDRKAMVNLLNAGWRVFVIWECGLKEALSVKRLAWLPHAIQHGRKRLTQWPR